ncbi:MAG: YbaB/EbfC family nucleoid-associated protein [Nonomuraea sp.]|nr:YbaB/EbfC family nucleoid-associated protein [Nonomuraea sp.]NUP64350.1 YbaB/EbfC family nucleoid-associated protein [Nonomuraea sp.]NUP78484.1 YbaB/EbfC family nucleoid-associated protein [Nonomuraea sp.]NUS05496.1 YbaB/EbfC family nucleoid-associated protein [Nonomuraea sp.]NUT41648.1 YbaB/EbfC family nucleoid-associated protein [Thermoactinospora sp.]
MESPDVAGMRAYADELRDMFRQIQDAGVELHARARAVQVTETSRDGLVSVTVGSRGELVRLDIDPRVYRRPDARHLADSITETARRATERAQERITEIFEPVIPREEFQAHLDGDLETVLARLADRMEGTR